MDGRLGYRSQILLIQGEEEPVIPEDPFNLNGYVLDMYIQEGDVMAFHNRYSPWQQSMGSTQKHRKTMIDLWSLPPSYLFCDEGIHPTSYPCRIPHGTRCPIEYVGARKPS